jgi:hypothetical protein
MNKSANTVPNNFFDEAMEISDESEDEKHDYLGIKTRFLA